MRTETEESYQERLLVVLAYLQEHLDEPISLEALARVACFSPFHFHRIFRGMVGESVMEHVRRLRLERAARHLRRGGQPVTEIALDAGYQSLEGFSRAFVSHFGVPPSGYREASRSPKTGARTATGSGEVVVPFKRSVAAGRSADEGDVTVKTIEAIPVAYVRHVGPFSTVGGAWGRLCSWAGPRGLLGPATRFLGVWLDDPEITPPDRLRGDVCVTLQREIAPEGAVGFREIPGGDYAVVAHRGPYDQLPESYSWLCGQWAPAAGRELRDLPPFEVYLNNPQTTPPEGLLTEVCVPVDRTGSPRMGGPP